MAILKNACIIVDNVDNTGKRLIYNKKLSTYPVGMLLVSRRNKVKINIKQD